MHKSDKIHAHTIMMHSVQALYCNWDCHWDCLRILGERFVTTESVIKHKTVCVHENISYLCSAVEKLLVYKVKEKG